MRCLLRLPSRTRRVLLPLICNDLEVTKQRHLRFIIKCFHSVIRSPNVAMSTCAKLAVEGLGSAVSNSLSVVCESLRVRRETLGTCDATRIRAMYIQTDDETENDAIAGLLRDLLAARYHNFLIEEIHT